MRAQAKLIVMIRDPVKRVLSAFNMYQEAKFWYTVANETGREKVLGTLVEEVEEGERVGAAGRQRRGQGGCPCATTGAASAVPVGECEWWHNRGLRGQEGEARG